MTTDDEAMQEALAAAEAAVARDSRNVPALIRLADLSLRAAGEERALQLARRAAELAPGSFKTLRFFSGVLSVVGARDEAIEAGYRAVRLLPDNAEGRLHLGGLLLSEQRWKEAAEHLAHHVSLPDATPQGWRLLSTALLQLGRAERGIEAVERAIVLAPNQVEFRVHRASMLASRGLYGEALDGLAVAAEQDPGNASIWRSSSAIHEVLGDIPQALADAERAAALAPGNAELSRHLDHIRGMLGLEDGTAVDQAAVSAMVEHWTARPVRQPRAPAPEMGFVSGLRAQIRVVSAVLLRETRTRFGETRLGYFWAFFEPVSHLLTLGSVFSLLNHAPPPLGNSLFLFYLTGLLPFLMFTHVAQEVMLTLRSSSAVLQLPLVKRLDVVIARVALNFATQAVCTVGVLACSALLGYQGMPADPLTAMAAFIALGLIAAGTGVVCMVISGFVASWHTFFAAASRLLYFASGIYYSPIVMPAFARDILAWNPILQCIEWFRSGFYVQYEPHWVDRPYIVLWIIGALLVGLSLERAVRRRIRTVA